MFNNSSPAVSMFTNNPTIVAAPNPSPVPSRARKQALRSTGH